MKTAISVPDSVFERVERRVKALGVSRSEFFSRAAESYLHELDEQDLTARIDAAVALAGAHGNAEQREFAALAVAGISDAADDEW